MTISRTHAHAGQQALVLAYYESLTEARLDALDTLLADDFVEHELVPGLPPSVSGLKQKYAMLRPASAICSSRPKTLWRTPIASPSESRSPEPTMALSWVGHPPVGSSR